MDGIEVTLRGYEPIIECVWTLHIIAGHHNDNNLMTSNVQWVNEQTHMVPRFRLMICCIFQQQNVSQ